MKGTRNGLSWRGSRLRRTRSTTFTAKKAASAAKEDIAASIFTLSTGISTAAIRKPIKLRPTGSDGMG